MSNSEASGMRKAAENGFTLLEVLVSLSIIAIVMVSVIRLQGQTIEMCQAVQFYSIAPFLAQDKISETVLDPGAFHGGATGDFSPDLSGWTWEVKIEKKQMQLKESPQVEIAEIRVKIKQEPDGFRYTLSQYLPTEKITGFRQ